MMEPVMEALTSSISPARMAKSVMMSSAALPRVAFSRPPMRGPVCAAISSVAWPRMPAVGITASADRMNKSVGDMPTKRPMMATGASSKSTFTYFMVDRSSP